MLAIEKTNLTSINKIEEFSTVYKKLALEIELNEEEKSYILSCAIIFLKQYEEDKRFKSYLDIGYFIILKYSITYEDYLPLYDFAINFGYYPIAREIHKHNLIEGQLNLNDSLVELKLDNFKNENYIETIHQNSVRKKVLEDNSKEVSYIAPTSLGKSSIIIEHLLQNLELNNIGIIVPTKSLLTQTYNLIKKSKINRRILLHDEMFQNDVEFIAIFTQERALRLLDKNQVYFDILYIDEAHSLLDKDSRSILLTRLIRKNKLLNPSQKVIYLSPLINDSNNLKLNEDQIISEQRIMHNLKEPEIYEFRDENDVALYNRFVNEFYSISFEGDMYNYIEKKKGNKNFIYIRSPKKVEHFAKIFYEKLPDIMQDDIIQLVKKELENFVHEDFYLVKLIDKGIIYLHGKMPDIIKEYLEYCFKEIGSLNYLIANTVILEGINMPIDTLFILNTHKLDGKTLTNLIGRVNRLNYIFNDENNLYKLLPQIHFVNNDYYNRVNGKMKNKINTLRSNFFNDKVENPMLITFDIDNLGLRKADKEKQILRFEKIKSNELFLLENVENDNDKLKKYLINASLENLYDFSQDEILKKIVTRINVLKNNMDRKWNSLDIVSKIYELFIKDLEHTILSYEFLRLKNEHARNYYIIYYEKFKKNSLKQNILLTYQYFKARIREGNSIFYIGHSYGEIVKDSDNYNKLNEVYVDLSNKTEADIINLAVVKLKMEEDFVSYHLNKLVIALYDFELITKDEYELAIYATNDQDIISLLKTGLSLNLIRKLQKDNQIKNIISDENNNLITSVDFELYRNSIVGIYRFELDKYL